MIVITSGVTAPSRVRGHHRARSNCLATRQKRLMRAWELNADNTRTGLVQCRQPSLSKSIRKPRGRRGISLLVMTLQRGQGAPAPPQPQASGPSQGVAVWFSQTQPQSWQVRSCGQRRPGRRKGDLQ